MMLIGVDYHPSVQTIVLPFRPGQRWPNGLPTLDVLERQVDEFSTTKATTPQPRSTAKWLNSSISAALHSMHIG